MSHHVNPAIDFLQCPYRMMPGFLQVCVHCTREEGGGSIPFATESHTAISSLFYWYEVNH